MRAYFAVALLCSSLRAAVVERIPLAAVAARLQAAPPSAVLLDYDGTLVDRGPDGASLPVRPEIVGALTALLRAGLPVGIVTGRIFDASAASDEGLMGTWRPLLSKIPADLRRNLFFSGSFSGEFVAFDGQGCVETFVRSDWSPEEIQILRSAVDAAAAKSGLTKADFRVRETSGHLTAAFSRADPRAAVFAAALERELKARDLDHPVRGRDWIYVAKSDKEPGARRVVEAMRERGFAIDETKILTVGDDFREPGGSDAPLARAFPLALSVSVGDADAAHTRGSVIRLVERGATATLELLRTVLRGLGLTAPGV
jgi:hypothetical protein